MIILTQPNIESFNPTRVSSVVKYGQEYCLAEVPDDFCPTDRQMKVAKLDFWWAVEGSQLDASRYKLRKYKGGIIEGIMDQLNVSKEQNLAFGIYAIATDRVADEWQVWERSILGRNRK